MNRATILIGLFFISCILFFWNPFWSVTKPKQAEVASQYLPDFTATDMTLRQFNGQGYLSSLVHADEMKHYEQDVTVLINPSYIIYPKNGGARWKINASRGTFNQQDRVVLEKDVIISAINPEEKVQQIKAARLNLNLNNMLIESDSAIEIIGHKYKIEGLGLRASFNEQQFEIIKNIQAIYENTQS
ncbi:LPS export ABC transporter periplasmic protein LptC [Psychrobium sp. 1_MG-2023]|uniref:LPS export ABC transporter periplasmic protein LptC n=1 Tax=Psychrobium sp. 1_MG-2023 TaxID=3062624 RepID=UPI000C349E3B|nr:LPS export ABC transporter periplasmic protein LptC [Psychrobium sp. 1_MG-2023]MDP2560702.1 LPS export ABC transporter periplasmic protein LptC [Psychrobium sp. 1_MG-2023]PKF56597.1 LPS export ABC transporter periplasmic protein LptC [Alteromonadales bacterium alter-6D02]